MTQRGCDDCLKTGIFSDELRYSGQATPEQLQMKEGGLFARDLPENSNLSLTGTETWEG